MPSDGGALLRPTSSSGNSVKKYSPFDAQFAKSPFDCDLPLLLRGIARR